MVLLHQECERNQNMLKLIYRKEKKYGHLTHQMKLLNQNKKSRSTGYFTASKFIYPEDDINLKLNRVEPGKVNTNTSSLKENPAWYYAYFIIDLYILNK